MSDKTDVVLYNNNTDGKCAAGLINKIAILDSEYYYIRPQNERGLCEKLSKDFDYYLSDNYIRHSNSYDNYFEDWDDEEDEEDFSGDYNDRDEVETLYILDYTFKDRLCLHSIINKLSPKKIVWLDHHEDAEREMAFWLDFRQGQGYSEDYFRFEPSEENKSTCYMALEYIEEKYPEITITSEQRKVIELCRRYDVWDFDNDLLDKNFKRKIKARELEDAMCFATGMKLANDKNRLIISTSDMLSEWISIFRSDDDTVSYYIAQGKPVVDYQKKFAEQVSNLDSGRFIPISADTNDIDGCALLLNLPLDMVNVVSHFLLSIGRAGVIIVYRISDRDDGRVYVSIRASKDLDYDFHCGRFMAEHFYGGGTKYAASGWAENINALNEILEKIADDVDTEEGRRYEEAQQRKIQEEEERKRIRELKIQNGEIRPKKKKEK